MRRSLWLSVVWMCIFSSGRVEAWQTNGAAALIAGVVLAGGADPARTAQRRHFARAQALYLSGRFREALAEYQKALEARFHPVIVFNIAQCYRQLGEWKKALFAYRLYLEKRPGAPNRAEVEQWIRVLERRVAQEERRRRLGQLSVVSQPPGALVRVDDPKAEPAGRAPLVLSLPAGPHVVFLDFGGGWIVQRVVEVKAGRIVSVTVGKAVREATGQITIMSDPPGASVRVDSPVARPAGLTPLTLTLPAGRHMLYFDFPGTPQQERLVTVLPGRVVVVRVDRGAAEVGNLSFDESPGRPGFFDSTPTSTPWWVIASWWTLGLTGIAGVTTGIMALAKYRSWKDLGWQDDLDTSKKLGIATGALLGTALVAALVGGIGTLVIRRRAKGHQSQAWLLPGCTGDGCALVFGGAF